MLLCSYDVHPVLLRHFRYKAPTANKLVQGVDQVAAISHPTVALIMDTVLTAAARAVFSRMNIDSAQSDAHQVRDCATECDVAPLCDECIELKRHVVMICICI